VDGSFLVKDLEVYKREISRSNSLYLLDLCKLSSNLESQIRVEKDQKRYPDHLTHGAVSLISDLEASAAQELILQEEERLPAEAGSGNLSLSVELCNLFLFFDFE